MGAGSSDSGSPFSPPQDIAGGNQDIATLFSQPELQGFNQQAFENVLRELNIPLGTDPRQALPQVQQFIGNIREQIEQEDQLGEDLRQELLQDLNIGNLEERRRRFEQQLEEIEQERVDRAQSVFEQGTGRQQTILGGR